MTDYLNRGVVGDLLKDLKNSDNSDDVVSFCSWWNNGATTNGQRNAVCTAASLPNGCELCK